MKQRIWEIGKTLVIVVLVIAILALTLLALPSKTLMSTPWLAATLKPFAGAFGLNQAELTYTQKAEPSTDAALPLAISVRNMAGRYSCRYDEAAVESLYETLGPTLGQALDTAENPQPVTREQLYGAMCAQGVTLMYDVELPAQVLSAWLGEKLMAQAPAASIYVLSVQENDAVRLYLGGETCHVYDTALSAEALLQILDTCRPDGSSFAMENSETFGRIDPASLISGQTPVLTGVEASNPCDARFMTQTAILMGFNPYGETAYTDQQGNAFFSETDTALAILADGHLTLTVDTPAERFTADSEAPEAVIEAARGLLAQITAGVTGDARLYLSDYEPTPDGAICRFDYVLDAVPILLEQGSTPAAEAIFEDGALTQMTLYLRHYTPGNSVIPLIPAAQAAAIVKQGALLRACYEDTGAAVLNAGWKME